LLFPVCTAASVRDGAGCRALAGAVSGFGLLDGDGVSQKQPVLSAESFGEPNEVINALLCSSVPRERGISA